MKKAKIVYSIFVIMVVIILPLSLYIKSQVEETISKGIFLINGQEVVVSDGTVIGGDSLIIPEFDKNYFDNIKNDQEKEKEYKLVKGVNGVYTYRCMKKCSEECGSSCKSCIMNGESFKRPPYCNFDYSAPTKIGWIGCPNCGDVSSSRWNDWYKRKLDEAYDSK